MTTTVFTAPSSWLGDRWESVRDSYLLIPLLMLVGGIGAAIGMVYLDEVLRVAGVQVPWLTTLTADAARTILSSLAGSMATIAGVVFSITVVALQLAASQFGPHVMRGFLSDRGSQFSLGTFVGTFVYSVVVLVSGRAHGGFVPYAATYFGLLLGIAAMVVLVYFINHIANLVRVESVITALSRNLEDAVENVFPERLGRGELVEREREPEAPCCGLAVGATSSGYVRRIDVRALMRLATRHDLLVGLAVRPGDYVLSGTTMMTIVVRSVFPGKKSVSRLCATVVLGDRRTPYQDVAYAFQRLTEVALRALSPGINAPYTAIPAIDAIAHGLLSLASRRMPSLRRVDGKGSTRVIVTRPQTVAQLGVRALGPVASAARGHVDVTIRVIEAALIAANRCQDEPDGAELRAFAESVAEEARAVLGACRERDLLAKAYAAAVRWNPGSERITP